MMKVLLVNTPTQDLPLARDMAGGLGFDRGEQIVLPPLDLAYLAASVRLSGMEADLLDPDPEGLGSPETLRRCLKEDWDVAICTASLPSLRKDCAFVKELRDKSNRPVVIFTNITELPIFREFLLKSSADFGLFGECELIIGRILRGETTDGTIRLEDNTLQPYKRSIVEDVDLLPVPARDLLPNSLYRYFLLGNRQPVTTVQTSRGCPFKCAYYCPYPLVQGKAWRARSPEHVLQELQEIIQRYSIHNVLFRDAVFTLDKDRCHTICDEILKKQLPLRWWCETRADFLDGPLLKIMRRSGCQGINVGVETGDPDVLKTQAKAGLTHDRLAEVVQLAHRLGIRIHFLIMVGLPGETRQSLYQTHSLIKALRPDSIGVTIVTPYPGTPLYREAQAKGWIESSDWEQYGGHSAVFHTDHLSSTDLIYAKRNIEKLFFLQSSRRWRDRRKFRIRSSEFRKWASQAQPIPRRPPQSTGLKPVASKDL